MSGQKLDKSTIFSSRKSLDYPISGKISQRRPALTSLLQEEIPLSNLLPGNTFLVVLGLLKNSLIAIPTSHWSAVFWLSDQPPFWQFLSRTQEEPITLIRLGLLNWEETILQLLKLSVEFHSKKGQAIYSREVSHWLWINSYSGQPTSTFTFSWRISSSYFGSTMISVMNGVNSFSCLCHSVLPQLFHILLITLARW